ncbi:MAG: hypothetical protein ACYC35_12465 [Pirellulales bacterium]
MKRIACLIVLVATCGGCLALHLGKNVEMKSPPRPKKWEYTIRESPVALAGANSGLGEELRRYGDEGWELVSVNGGTMIFKRAVDTELPEN